MATMKITAMGRVLLLLLLLLLLLRYAHGKANFLYIMFSVGIYSDGFHLPK